MTEIKQVETKPELKGKDVQGAILMEDVVILYVEDGTYESHNFYLSHEELLKILKSHNYSCEKKRVRTHIKMK